MKTKKLLAIFIFGLILGSGVLNAQALVQKDFNWWLETNDGLYPAVDMMAVFTPSGNILHKQIFMVDEDDSIVPEKGVNKVSFITWVTIDGVKWEMVDAEGIVYPNGKVFIVFHSNGAGTITPRRK